MAKEVKNSLPLIFGLALIGLMAGFSFLAINLFGAGNDGILDIKEVKADVATSTVTVGNVTPTVSSVTLNGGSAITLIENATKTVYLEGTITDNNGFADISSATGTVYRSGQGGNCTADNNNCYQLACTIGDVTSTNAQSVTCTADIWFHGEPSSDWMGQITAVDAQASDHSATSATVTLNTLNALDVTNAIAYSTLAPGAKDATLTHEVNVTTTGNAAIDTEIQGTDMCLDYDTCAEDILPGDNQEYATATDVSHGSGYDLSTSSAASLELDSATPTAHPSNAVDSVYHGIEIPGTQATGTYTGENTFSSVAD